MLSRNIVKFCRRQKLAFWCFCCKSHDRPPESTSGQSQRQLLSLVLPSTANGVHCACSVQLASQQPQKSVGTICPVKGPKKSTIPAGLDTPTLSSNHPFISRAPACLQKPEKLDNNILHHVKRLSQLFGVFQRQDFVTDLHSMCFCGGALICCQHL